MKTNRFFIIAALSGALLTAPALHAQAQVNATSEHPTAAMPGSSRLQVVQTKPLQFRVFFDKPQSSKIAVRVVNAAGEVLFTETRTLESSYVRYFDLSPLHDGVYTFEVVDGQEKYNQSFDILTKTRRIVSSIK